MVPFAPFWIQKRVFIRFERLYPRFLGFCLKFSKKLEKSCSNFFLSFSGKLTFQRVYFRKSNWETDKVKFYNFFFKCFEIFEENPKKVGYKRLNQTKTRENMFKWNSQILKFFKKSCNFFEILQFSPKNRVFTAQL